MSWRSLTQHSTRRTNPVDDLLARIVNLPAGLDLVVAAAAAGFSFVSAYVSNAPFVSLISALVALSFAFIAVNATGIKQIQFEVVEGALNEAIF